MSKTKLIENISEIGAGTRGSSLGIEALKIADFNLELGFLKSLINPIKSSIIMIHYFKKQPMVRLKE